MSSLTDSRVRHGAKACVDAVHRADYPKFNKCLLSQCEAPEKYGVQLVPEAAAAIKALDAPKNRSDKRRKVNLPDFPAIVRAAMADGMDICVYCQSFGCNECIVNEWKSERSDEE